MRWKALEIPYKKPRKSKNNPNPELTKEQKEYNKFTGKKRVVVENSISGMKRYFIISNRIRIRNLKDINNILLICAALWNLRKINQ